MYMGNYCVLFPFFLLSLLLSKDKVSGLSKLQVKILLPVPLGCWDDRHAPSHSGFSPFNHLP